MSRKIIWILVQKQFWKYTDHRYSGIFAVSRKHIRQRSSQSYRMLVEYINKHSNPEAGHYFERAWLAIFSPV